MLLNFFDTLRRHGLAVGLGELLTLVEALKARVVFASWDDFYLLAKTVMVKDETHFDRFDRAFSAFFEGVEAADSLVQDTIPDDWLRANFDRELTQEQRDRIEELGGIEALIEAFNKRLSEQKKRHQGGNRWIGTGGSSPFGNSGSGRGGVRVGGSSKHRQANKVWERRQYRNLDDGATLGTRTIQMAVRKLRRFARTGAEDELDLSDTINSTAAKAGLLDIKMRPERHNAAKVLLFFDIGGSMDEHVKVCEALFTACRSEFKHLEFYYFHNCVYETVWRDNLRRNQEQISVDEIRRTFSKDYRCIFVGDASMAPYEITSPYGSIEHMNPEPGAVSLQKLVQHFRRCAWLNPIEASYWEFTPSIHIVRQILDGNMFSMTLDGLSEGIRHLSR